MRVDVMTSPRELVKMSSFARRTHESGYDGIVFTEGGRTAFLAAAVAAVAQADLDVSTGVAVAFARSPMTSAQVAWELQQATGGRFRLGLGTQVRAHVERRYGAAFDRPGPRLRDYVGAVKACFAAFRGAPLEHHGGFYDLTLLTEQWSPGPIEEADPPVDVAAVNPWMLRMAGEVADGVHIHPVGEPGYIRHTALPNIADGARRVGRDPSSIDLIVPVSTIVGDTDAEVHTARERARQTLAFYASTPNYAFVFDGAGFEGTTERVRAHLRAGELDAMTAVITDDHLAVFCIEASWDRLADRIIETYDGLASRLAMYNAATAGAEVFERYGVVAAEISRRTGGRA